MKSNLCLLIPIVFLRTFFANAQPGEWTWVHGSSSANAPAVMGVQGIPSPANVPIAMYESCEFKDLNGNYWIYGGVSVGTQNNLWKYDPVANEWTWMSGNNVPNDAGVFGVQGVPSPTNRPPALGYGTASWTDLNGNFWLIGGYNAGDMNCLWRYDVSTNEWTWMKGSNSAGDPGTYGIQGIPSPLNTPGARNETAVAWTDNNGNLWLFGGYAAGNMNDLWKYDVVTNEWTWMRGAQVAGQAGVYGTMGVEDPANTPGGRQAYSKWKDLNGNLWLFGGGNYMSNTYFNDMWRYNPVTNNWTWMNGSNVQNAPASYGIQCVSSPSNVPESRFESRATCTDQYGNFWLFGGGTGGGTIPQVWNDLWMYCPTTNQWTWMDNDTTYNPAGNWGTQGVTSPANKPNGRSGNALWSDNSGHLFTFGGSTNNYNTPFQDVWKYNLDPSCSLCSTIPIALFSAPNHICPGTCTNFINLSMGATSFVWNFPGAVPSSSTDVSPQNICYNTPGNYSATLIATNINGSDTLTLTNYIQVYPYPPPQGISQSGDTLFAIPGAVSYQWYVDGSIIPGATQYYFIAQHIGDYNVVATDVNGCEVEAVIYDVIASLPEFGHADLRVYPNPVTGELNIDLKTAGELAAEIFIYNVPGEIVRHEFSADGLPFTMDVRSLPDGLYFLNIHTGDALLRTRFVKQ